MKTTSQSRFTCPVVRLASTRGGRGGTGVQRAADRGRHYEVGRHPGVRAISGLSLWHSKLLLEAAPVVVVEDAWFEAADKVAKRLEAAGARAVLVCGWCDRRIPSGAVGLDPDPCESPYWPAESCRASSPPTEQTKK
ncbi:ribosomal protein L7/L12 [Kitasatospora sp. NPDC004745]|uniref:ribosomal protein L7/L12 n=1 Tax=Kitasatospora sp. NPDC004745 TaxID=3364019 RepID=UPI0036933B94